MVCIDGRPVHTKELELESACFMTVEAGTNGLHGGDSGHGCRTYISIMDEGGCDIRVQKLHDRYGCDGVEIVLGGDCELKCIIEGLKFIVKTLEAQA